MPFWTDVLVLVLACFGAVSGGIAHYSVRKVKRYVVRELREVTDSANFSTKRLNDIVRATLRGPAQILYPSNKPGLTGARMPSPPDDGNSYSSRWRKAVQEAFPDKPEEDNQ